MVRRERPGCESGKQSWAWGSLCCCFLHRCSDKSPFSERDRIPNRERWPSDEAGRGQQGTSVGPSSILLGDPWGIPSLHSGLSSSHVGIWAPPATDYTSSLCPTQRTRRSSPPSRYSLAFDSFFSDWTWRSRPWGLCSAFSAPWATVCCGPSQCHTLWEVLGSCPVTLSG